MATEKFQTLRKDLSKGRLLLPGDEGFDDSLKRWSATCVKPAAAVAQPRTAEEVSAVVKFATVNNIAFNVRGGGHSTAQSSSAPSPDGMVLDLALLRDISVDVEAKTISFGGGCVWREVDAALWEHGLATVGGTVSHTGVGGLILHGGYGVLTGLHGMAVDVLLSCEVVLADGSIVTASKTENADLFWALCGAGSSYGVVTKFTSQAFPQGEIWGGVTIMPKTNLPAVVDFINHWAETNDGTQTWAVGFTRAPATPDADPKVPRPPVLFAQVIHVGPNALEDGPKYFESLLKLEALMQQVGPMPYPQINKGGDEIFAPGKRYLMGGANFTAPMKVSTAETIIEKFHEFIESHLDCQGSVCMFECIPHAKTKTVAADSTSFNSRGNYYNLASVITYTDESLDQEVREFNRGFLKSARSFGYDDAALADGVGHYVNYASTSTTPETAFGANAERLKVLKQQYDPQNVFDKLWKLLPKVEEQKVAV